MLLNFLDASLTPSVQCSATAEDDYSEQNLIAASDSPAFASGFMAYSVVKPPVDLIFTLCCPIELQSIILMTRSGSLKSNGFEVFTRVANIGSTSTEFRKVGQIYNLKHDGVLFFNTYTANKYSSQIRSYGDKMHCSQLFLNLGRRALVHQVKITIKSTERCVPVMKQVQILGLPAPSLSLDSKMVIMAKWERRKVNSKPIDLTTNDKETDNNEPSADAIQSIINATIPDEFLDCITYDMMSLPMVLPSGKIVDKSTLDKHSKSDESWGRSPSDPFTGVPFTANSKPILNAALKSQIDKFLLINQHRPDTKSIPRTVGAAVKRPSSGHHFALYSTDSTNVVSKRFRPEQIGSGAMVEGSLDDSVRLALSSLTRFTKHSTVSTFSSSEIEKCRSCNSEQILYRINQCMHLVCRKCLLDGTGTDRSCVCGRDYGKSDVVRYFRKDVV